MCTPTNMRLLPMPDRTRFRFLGLARSSRTLWQLTDFGEIYSAHTGCLKAASVMLELLRPHSPDVLDTRPVSTLVVAQSQQPTPAILYPSNLRSWQAVGLLHTRRSKCRSDTGDLLVFLWSFGSRSSPFSPALLNWLAPLSRESSTRCAGRFPTRASNSTWTHPTSTPAMRDT